jgi:hypothetical protein
MFPWHGILDIPEGASGSFEVIHHIVPPETKMERVTHNQTVLDTIPYEDPLVFPVETRWLILRDGGGVWMTDYPLCQNSIDDALKPIQKGNVIVGGLGLGYAVQVLVYRPEITRIYVVEQSEDVLNLIIPHLDNGNGKVEYIHDDLFKVLEEFPYLDEDIDWAFFDIWRAEEDDVFFSFIDPLIRSTRRHLKQNRIICWNEGVFRRMMQMAIEMRFNGWFAPSELGGVPPLTIDELCTVKGDIYHDWLVPFFQQVKAGKIDRHNMREKSEAYTYWYGRRDDPFLGMF